jgi:hypothetical protein
METGLQLNENVIRFNALLTIIIALLVIIFKNEWLALFLSIDFFLRGFTELPSPMSFFSKSIVKLLQLAPISVYAPPKKFAAKVGFIFSSLIFIFTFLNWEIFTLVISIILIFCAFLEALLKICVGCYVYNWFIIPVFYKPRKNKNLSE